MNNGDKPVTQIRGPATNYGLTKREHFAGLALQGILASGLEDAAIYECAVHAADKLLEELDK